MKFTNVRFWVASAAVAAACTLAACGGSSSSGGSSGSASSSTQADTAAAKAAIAPYVGKPGAFPVDQPLGKKLPAGTRMNFLQCVTPVCGLLAQIAQSAVQTLGGQFQVVKAGASTQQLQTAFSTILERKPHAILLPAIEPDSVTQQLRQAAAAKVPITSTGIMDSAQSHISAASFGTPTAVLAGKLMADWVVAQKGSGAKVVFYLVPELSFGKPIAANFQAEIKRVCPACSVRVVDIPVASVGTTAPSQMVSDLQSHPDTDVAVFSAMEEAHGLPAALRGAGLHITTVGFAPSPVNLQDIKAGSLTAALGLDLPTIVWTMVDEAARLINNEPLTKGEEAQVMPMQFLTAKDLKFDVSKGWTGYPDFATRFAKLWGVA